MTDAKTGAVSLVAMIAIVAASALYYVLLVKRRGAWVLKQPSDLQTLQINSSNPDLAEPAVVK